MASGKSISAAIREIGRGADMDSIGAAAALYAGQHETDPYKGVEVVRDIAYGPHERHRLDVFRAADHAGEPRPVFLFVHGGGFMGGDKHMPGAPYYDNIMLWAVRNGMTGVNITYRLAPEHPWPAGSDDVAAAVDWTRAHIGEHGGDPKRLFVGGASAGAVHVAGFVVGPKYGAEGKIKGAALLSCLFDMTTSEPNPMKEAYFGTDASKYAQMSTLKGLVATTVPVLVTLAELDPADFERQTLQYVNAFWDAHGRWPDLVRVMGHNHFTTGWHINTADDRLARTLLDFVHAHGGAP
jgi:triacylglycerol lipase